MVQVKLKKEVSCQCSGTSAKHLAGKCASTEVRLIRRGTSWFLSICDDCRLPQDVTIDFIPQDD